MTPAHTLPSPARCDRPAAHACAHRPAPCPSDADWVALDGLSVHTLKDIGAPAWVLERARTRRDPALSSACW